MPYQTARTEDVENPLFLRKFGVPYWVLAHIYGRNDMYWYRLEQALGRFNLVGTTVKSCRNTFWLMRSIASGLERNSISR